MKSPRPGGESVVSANAHPSEADTVGIRNLLVNVALAAKAGATFDPSGVAAHLIDRYDKHRDKARLRAELEELLQARFGHFREEVAGAMADERLQLSDDVRGQVQAYLQQFQASAKQAARALGEPSATTVPATVGVDDPSQLAAFLPQRPPRFKVGDAVPGLSSWALTEPLGAGGFGEVWKAENPLPRRVPGQGVSSFLSKITGVRLSFRADA